VTELLALIPEMSAGDLAGFRFSAVLAAFVAFDTITRRKKP
jgi:hypothetical protein